MLADGPLLGPQVRWTQRDAICQCGKPRRKLRYVEGPKDSYDFTANNVAAFTQITPEIVSANWKIWPPDMNYVQKGDHVEGWFFHSCRCAAYYTTNVNIQYVTFYCYIQTNIILKTYIKLVLLMI
jgi:hypothetical protein